MKRAEIIRLCEELMRDFNTEIISIEVIVNKAHHIAELAGRKDAAAFLYCESIGYSESEIDNSILDYLRRTKRLKQNSQRYTPAPAAIIAAGLKDDEAKIRQLELAKVTESPVNAYLLDIQIRDLQEGMQRGREIIHNVRSLIYHFVSSLRAEIKFAEQTAGIFSRYQERVDARIAEAAEDALNKLPSVFERLNAGTVDIEAISHALTSCRRIIEVFADAVFPPRSEPVKLGDHEISCAAGRVKNQIQAYIWDSTNSSKRRERLDRNMRLLYERVCAGVHSDVAPTEAQALVLNTYLLLGELVDLTETNAAP